VVDHYRRVDSNRVVGVLLGSKDTHLHVTNSFAVPFEEDESGNWFFDTSYQQNMFDLFKKVNSKEFIIGWYHSGPKMMETDVEIAKSFSRYVEDPILVIVDVKMSDANLPIQVFRLKDDITSSKDDKVFVHMSSRIEAEEAEEVGVEHLIRDIRDETVGDTSNEVKEIRDSLNMYEKNLMAIEEYLENVITGRMGCNHDLICFLQECLNDVPRLKARCEENTVGIYASCLSKSVVMLNDLLKNRRENEKETVDIE
jgi:26S proteasome regulatory subunit N8